MEHEPSKGSENQHPIFSQPLEEIQVTLARDRFFHMPESSDHIVRFESYTSAHEALMCAKAAIRELDILQNKYGVTHVDYQDIIGEDERGSINVYQHVELIKDAVSVKELLSRSEIETGDADEIEKTAAGLALHIRDTLNDGGIISPEFTRIEQFIVSPSRPNGNKMVLVDVSPMNPQVVTRKEQQHETGKDSVPAVNALAVLIDEYIVFRSKAATHRTYAEDALQEAVDAIKGNDPAIERIKKDFLHMIATGDVAAMQDIKAIVGDEDDNGEEVDAYWDRFVTRTSGGSKYVDTFDSIESVERYIATGEIA